MAKVAVVAAEGVEAASIGHIIFSNFGRCGRTPVYPCALALTHFLQGSVCATHRHLALPRAGSALEAHPSEPLRHSDGVRGASWCDCAASTMKQLWRLLLRLARAGNGRTGSSCGGAGCGRASW
eukprot:892142-Pleurochrysis_carterae.AAC.6